MIITVTLNPALDKTARLETVQVKGLNRLREVSVDAGGKGVNVSAMIHTLGGNSIAVGFLGGGAGEELAILIERKGLRSDFVRIPAASRSNLKILDQDGDLTEFNEPGPLIPIDAWRELEQKLCSYGKSGNTVVLSGSLPPGLGKDTYRNLTAMLRRSGAVVLLDADGESLKLALEAEAEAVPQYIKPNQYELLQYFGIPDDPQVKEAQLVRLCCTLLDRGITLVALSRGAMGALFVSKRGVWRAPAVSAPVRSTVGAGDSMTGALVYGFEQGLKEEACFALAMAASAGACTTEGTNPPSRALVDSFLPRVRIEKIETIPDLRKGE
jgi:1-phosphofructokinase